MDSGVSGTAAPLAVDITSISGGRWAGSQSYPNTSTFTRITHIKDTSLYEQTHWSVLYPPARVSRHVTANPGGTGPCQFVVVAYPTVVVSRMKSRLNPGNEFLRRHLTAADFSASSPTLKMLFGPLTVKVLRRCCSGLSP